MKWVEDLIKVIQIDETKNGTFTYYISLLNSEPYSLGIDPTLFLEVYEILPFLLTDDSYFPFKKKYKKYALGYTLFAYELIKHYKIEETKTWGLTNVIIQDIINYNKGIECFLSMSNEKRFENRPPKIQK